MKKRVAIYTRVSTKEQNAEPQLKLLRDYARQRGWDVVGEFSDKDHGDNNKRKDYLAMLDLSYKRKCDIVLVHRFDRFARNTKELLIQSDELHERNIDFVSYTENIDTTTPIGKYFFQNMAAVKEFELNLIRERIRIGITHAKKHGTRSGNPIGKQPLDFAEIREVARLFLDGTLTPKQIQKKAGVSKSSFYKVARVVEALRDDKPLDPVRKQWNVSQVMMDRIQGVFRNLKLRPGKTG